jgi:uncharacterized protein YjdB
MRTLRRLRTGVPYLRSAIARPALGRVMHRILRRAGLTTACLITLAVLDSCADATVTPIRVASITLTPPTSTVAAGNTIALAARPLDAAGASVDVPVITWSTSNASVATVSASGIVSALTAGDARIAASAFGKSATATITVTAKAVASVVVTPATVSLRVGVTTPLQAQALDAEGVVLTGRSVTWTSSNPAIATVSASGTVVGVAAGATTVTATSGGRSGQAAVTVTLPPVQTVVVSPTTDTLGIGTERQHTAVLRDASGAILTGRAITWNSANVAIASVTSAGVVTGQAPGITTISATSEGRLGTATVLVLARLAGAVTLTPSTSTLIVGATQPLTVQITDTLGNLLTGRPVSYSSSAPSVASVSATGLVTAVSAGSARITATSESKSGSATINVINEPVVTLTLTPATLALLTGASQALTLVARASNGAVLTGRTATFTSGAPNIATVSPAGLVTAVAPGTALILVVVDGVAATATVTVRLPTIAAITLTPVDPTIVAFEQLQLVATPRDASGTSLTGRSNTWTSADESIAFVSSAGLVVGFKAGTVRITATSEGVSASTLVTVR